MLVIKRTLIGRALDTLIQSPEKLSLFRPGIERNRVADALQDIIYNGADRTRAENYLAYLSGYDCIEG